VPKPNKMQEALAALGPTDEEYFPGSRKKRGEKIENTTPEEDAWDSNPVTYLIKGVDQEFFFIGALAQALNKKPVTIRRWITEGVIPEARYRSPKIPNTRGGAGRRLWTRAQINAIVKIAKDEGVFEDPKKSRSIQFKARVRKALTEIET
jgi:hypothetical protein